MKKRIYSSILIVITLALLFVLKICVENWGNYFFDAFFGIVACIASFEMSRLLTKSKKYNFQILSVIFPAITLAVNLVCAIYAQANSDLYFVLWSVLINIGAMVVVALATFLIQLMAKSKVENEMRARGENTTVAKFAFKKSLNTLITFIYPGFFFLFMIFINHMSALPLGKLDGVSADLSILILLSAILIPMISDTFAMLTGTVIGGKKLCPKISPNKTLSGAIGGLLWPVLLLTCLYLVFANLKGFSFISTSFPIWAYLIIVLIGAFIAILGDLFESLIKRRAGVSDSGNLIPGHGGLLDRVDSYIFVAPYIFVAFLIFAL